MTTSTKPLRIRQILAKIETLLESPKEYTEASNAADILEALGDLRLLGSDSDQADAIYERQSIDLLAKVGVRYDNSEVAQMALRCLANALLLKPEARQTLIELDQVSAIAGCLESSEFAIQGICCRILFLLTYEKSYNSAKLVEHNDLAPLLLKILERHQEAQSPTQTRATWESMSLNESLRLIFNTTAFAPSTVPELSSTCAPCILQLLLNESLPSATRSSSCLPNIINALLNLDIDSLIYPETDSTKYATKLVSILTSTEIHDHPNVQQDLLPLITLLTKISMIPLDQATSSPAATSALPYLQQHILPSDLERLQPLGKSETLPSRLLRLTSASRNTQLADGILSLMFTLSKRSVDAFVYNVGYGFASGFLVNHNLAQPKELAARHGGGDNGSGHDGGAGNAANSHLRLPAPEPSDLGNGPRDVGQEDRDRVNFVTGQFLAHESRAVADGEEMTEDEKLREAERLFVLFERLKRTGVVDVRNPVETAVQEGRFEEIE